MMTNKNKPCLDKLLDDLYHPNPNINKKAAIEICMFWPDEAKDILFKNFSSENVQYRRKSIKALAYFGPDLVKDIVKQYFLKDDLINRVSCLKILVVIASRHKLQNFQDEVNHVLESAINDSSVEVILSCINLLRQLGKESLPSLKRLCRDSNLLRAKAAITALIEIPDKETKQFLIDLSNDSSLDIFVRDNAKEALSSY